MTLRQVSQLTTTLYVIFLHHPHHEAKLLRLLDQPAGWLTSFRLYLPFHLISRPCRFRMTLVYASQSELN